MAAALLSIQISNSDSFLESSFRGDAKHQARNDRQRTYAIPRRNAPELCFNRPDRGRRECRALDAPAASYAGEKSIRASHHGHTGFTRHSPRNGFNGFLRALPGVPGLLATVVGRLLRRSDTSVGVSGPHDFAVRVKRHSSKAPPRPPHPAPRFVTIASRPSVGRDGKHIRLIWVFRKTEYFSGRGWTKRRKR